MQEALRTIGVGFALVDEKITSSSVKLPSSFEEVQPFLDKFPERFSTGGGSIANVMSAFAAFAEYSDPRFFCTIGDDERGFIFRRDTTGRLGNPRVVQGQPTGVCVFAIDRKLVEEVTFYGAAEHIFVPKDEALNQRLDLLVTNVNACRKPQVFEQVDDLLKKLGRDGGVFAFRLSGAGHDFVERNYLKSMLSSFRCSPQIVFCNSSELSQLGNENNEANIDSAEFGNSRLVIVTDAENGAVVTFEGDRLFVPANPLSNKLIDPTGAGDAFMGVMLGSLFTKPYEKWDVKHVYSCAQTASLVGSMAVETLRSRLNESEIAKAKKYFGDLTIPS